MARQRDPGVRGGDGLALARGKQANRIFDELLVCRDQYEIVMNRLADEHPIEGVAVKRRQIEQVRNRSTFEWQRGNSVLRLLCLEILIRRRRKAQPPELILDERLPDRHHAQVRLVLSAAHDVGDGRGKAPVIRDVPEEDVGIE